MTALAALRVGAGLVTAAVPAPALQVVASIAPELMTWPLTATADGPHRPKESCARHLAALTGGENYPRHRTGNGAKRGDRQIRHGLLAATQIPAVVDADALNILAAKPALLAKLAKRRTLVLTPHPGEMARLAGITWLRCRRTASRWRAVFPNTLALRLC